MNGDYEETLKETWEVRHIFRIEKAVSHDREGAFVDGKWNASHDRSFGYTKSIPTFSNFTHNENSPGWIIFKSLACLFWAPRRWLLAILEFVPWCVKLSLTDRTIVTKAVMSEESWWREMSSMHEQINQAALCITFVPGVKLLPIHSPPYSSCQSRRKSQKPSLRTTSLNTSSIQVQHIQNVAPQL